ncbi:MAG: DUF2934 domain-containing protein [Pseudomonadota bacterium]
MASKSNTNERTQGLNLRDPKVFEAIQRRAYELYCKRGHTNGNDMKDWLEAEQSVKREMRTSR